MSQGEIGKDMFIVNQGEVTVIGDEGEILAHLKAGSVFGEIRWDLLLELYTQDIVFALTCIACMDYIIYS